MIIIVARLFCLVFQTHWIFSSFLICCNRAELSRLAKKLWLIVLSHFLCTHNRISFGWHFYSSFQYFFELVTIKVKSSRINVTSFSTICLPIFGEETDIFGGTQQLSHTAKVLSSQVQVAIWHSSSKDCNCQRKSEALVTTNEKSLQFSPPFHSNYFRKIISLSFSKMHVQIDSSESTVSFCHNMILRNVSTWLARYEGVCKEK